MLDRGYRRREWLAGTQDWLLFVYGDSPDTRQRVTLPRQSGRDELGAGLFVTVVFVGDEPIWVRLPNGDSMETEAHPWRAASLQAGLALLIVGSGLAGVETAFRTAAERGSWFGRARFDMRPGIFALVGALGLVGLLVYLLVSNPPLISVIALLVLAYCLWRIVRPIPERPAKRRKSVARRRAGA